MIKAGLGFLTGVLIMCLVFFVAIPLLYMLGGMLIEKWKEIFKHF